MTSWQIYHGPDGSVEPVKEGFNFTAFLFHGLWALSQRLYLPGAVGLGGMLVSAYLHHYQSQTAVAVILLFALMLVFGTLGNAWYTGRLIRLRYRHLGNLKAPNKKAAELEARNFYSDLQANSTVS